MLTPPDPTAEPALYRLRELRFSYGSGEFAVQALDGVSAEIARGDFICVSGPSGSGKTTLLNLLGLIESVQGGALEFCGDSLASLTEPQKNRIRRYRLGFVFQTFQLFPVLSAHENVEYFLTREGLPRDERRERVRRALDAVGIWELRRKRPAEMSGGQRQRVAIARAIAKQPEVIIADEPTANLDQANGRGVMEVLRTLNRERAMTLILSSHDPMVQAFAPRRFQLVDGRLC